MKENNTDLTPYTPQPPIPPLQMERGTGGEVRRILYEDNHLLIVNKLPGEIVQGDKTGDEPLVESLKQYLKEKYNKPGAVFLGVVHRLDRPVSGAVIFARTSKALARMNEMLKKRDIRKVYWAICPHPVSLPHLGEGRGGGWEHLTHYLHRNEKQNKSYVYDQPGEGRQKAELKYRKIASGVRYILLEIELLTGRHHQIRAQLAAIGLPIKGDLKYGAPRSNPAGSISLHARSVEFVHPVSKEQISIVAPVPEEKLWNSLCPAGTNFDNPGRSPGTAGRSPGTAGRSPGTAGRSPGTAGRSPGTAGHSPGTAGRSPGTAGRSPGTERSTHNAK